MAPAVLAGCAKVFTSHLSARSPGIQRWTKQLAAGWEDAFLYIAAIPSGTQKCAVKIRENRSLAGVCKSVYRYDSGRYTYLHKKITFLTTNLPKYYDYAVPGKQKWAVNMSKPTWEGTKNCLPAPSLPFWEHSSVLAPLGPSEGYANLFTALPSKPVLESAQWG